MNDRLTLNYGVRYDVFRLAQPPVKNPDTQLAAMNLDTSKIPSDNNNFAPRFGFAYKTDRAGTLVVRGGYGIFYGPDTVDSDGHGVSQNGIQVQTYTLSQASRRTRRFCRRRRP